jgi:hypothetical protein
MGAGFHPLSRKFDCKGQGVTKELDKVFADNKKSEFQTAKDNNYFGEPYVQNVEGNWKDLLIAYLQAGVTVKGKEFVAWREYLELLGTGPAGAQVIYELAQARLVALTGDVGVTTTTHSGDHKVNKTSTSIDSPCPP